VTSRKTAMTARPTVIFSDGQTAEN
jgi:hypothetical protein